MRWTKTSAAMLGVVAAVALVACSSGTTVRSGSGPSVSGRSSGGASPSSTTASVAKAVPRNPPTVFTSSPLAIPPGVQGKLTVVLTGTTSGDFGTTLPVIVRNNTSHSLSQIEVTGTARGANNALTGSGSSQGFAPAVVQQGEWAMGFVYFTNSQPAGAKFDLTATGEDASSQMDVFEDVDLKVSEARLVPGQYGESQVVGIVSNPSTKTVDGGSSLILTCFAGNVPAYAEHVFVDGTASIPPNGTGSFSADLVDQSCGTFAIGGSGTASS